MVCMLILHGFSQLLLDIASLDLSSMLLRMKARYSKIMTIQMKISQGNHNSYVSFDGSVDTNIEGLIWFVVCSFLRSCRNPVHNWTSNEQLMITRRSVGGILNAKSLKTLKEKITIYYPFSFIFYNTKPIGHQVVNAFCYPPAISQKFMLLTFL